MNQPAQVKAWKQNKWIVDCEGCCSITRYGPFRFKWLANVVAWMLSARCF